MSHPEPEFDPDIDRCSRYLDDDLDPATRTEFEVELRDRSELRALLEELRRASQWAATPVELPTAELDRMMASVLDALAASPASPASPASGESEATVLTLQRRQASPVPPPRRQPGRRWAPLLQLGAAAAVVVAVAVVALGSLRQDSTTSSDQSALAQPAVQEQRAADAEEAESGVQSALTATTGAAASARQSAAVPPFEGSFADAGQLIDRLIQARTSTKDSQPPPTSGSEANGQAAAGESPCPHPAGAEVGTATVANRDVLWVIVRGPGPIHVVVRDAASCELLAERTG